MARRLRDTGHGCHAGGGAPTQSDARRCRRMQGMRQHQFDAGAAGAGNRQAQALIGHDLERRGDPGDDAQRQPLRPPARTDGTPAVDPRCFSVKALLATISAAAPSDVAQMSNSRKGSETTGLASTSEIEFSLR